MASLIRSKPLSNHHIAIQSQEDLDTRAAQPDVRLGPLERPSGHNLYQLLRLCCERSLRPSEWAVGDSRENTAAILSATSSV